MKKLIMATSIAVFVSLTASASHKHSLFVSDLVKDKFAEEFPGINDVSWSTDNAYMIAAFIQNNSVTKAYFTYDGEPIATVKEISFSSLPASVQKEIQKKYSDYTISTTLQFTDNDPYNESSIYDMPDQQVNYFISLVKSDKELILQVDGNNKIGFFEKIKV